MQGRLSVSRPAAIHDADYFLGLGKRELPSRRRPPQERQCGGPQQGDLSWSLCFQPRRAVSKEQVRCLRNAWSHAPSHIVSTCTRGGGVPGQGCGVFHVRDSQRLERHAASWDRGPRSYRTQSTLQKASCKERDTFTQLISNIKEFACTSMCKSAHESCVNWA